MGVCATMTSKGKSVEEMREVLDEVWRRIQHANVAMGRLSVSDLLSVANVSRGNIFFLERVDGMTADEIVSDIRKAYRICYDEDMRGFDDAEST